MPTSADYTVVTLTRAGRSLAYGSRYVIPFGALDGYTYRVLIMPVSYDGVVTELVPAGDPAIWSLGLPTIDGVAPPVQGSTLTISWVSTPWDRGATGDLISYVMGVYTDDTLVDPLQVMVRLEYDDGGTWRLLWTGYLMPGSVTDNPYEASAVQVLAVDGLGEALAAAVYAPTGSVTHDDLGTLSPVLQGLREPVHYLHPQPLRTLMRWHPYISVLDGGPMPPGDPLRHLYVADAVWRRYEVETRYRDVVTEVLRTFDLGLYQSEGYWWATQPDALLDDAEAYYEHDSTGVETAGPSVSSLLVDVDDVPLTALRMSGPRIAAVAASYVFEPDLEDVVFNGSFEEEGGGGTLTARYWTLSGGAERRRIDGIGGVDPTYTNAWALRIPELSGSNPSAVQQDLAYLIGSPEYHLVVSINSLADLGTPGEVLPAVARVRVGDHYLAEASIEIQQDVWRGEDVRIYVNPLFSSEPEGVPVLPEGAVYDMGGGVEVRLLRTAYTGDTELYARVTAQGAFDTATPDIPEGSLLVIHYWTTSVSAIPLDPLDFTGEWRTKRYQATMVSPSGDLVTGYLRLEFLPPVRVSGTPSGRFHAVDLVQVSLRRRNTPVSRYTEQYVRFEGAEPLEVAEVRLGDGPVLTTRTGLHAYISGVLHPTMQGIDTGWRVGRYGTLESSTRVPLLALRAREVLRRVVRGQLYRSLTLHLRDQRRILPHHVLTYSDEVSGATRRLWRRHYEWHVAMGYVQGLWRILYREDESLLARATTQLSEVL